MTSPNLRVSIRDRQPLFIAWGRRGGAMEDFREDHMIFGVGGT